MSGTKIQSTGKIAAWLRATALRRVAAIHWYPTPGELGALPVDTVLSLRRDSGDALIRCAISLLGTSLFCLVALNSSDSLLLKETPAVRLPLVETEISFLSFILAGPLVLLGLWTYLAVHRRYHLELGRALSARAVAPMPTFAELRHPFRRVIVGSAYLVVVPAVMAAFVWKAMAAGLGVVMVWYALLIAWFHVLAAAGLVARRATRWSFVVSGSAALIAFGIAAPRLGLTRAADLADADLAELILPGARLRGANAVGANFKGANLAKADLRGADLRRANLRGANLVGADLSDANFLLTDLRDADLSGAMLQRVRLTQSDATAAHFTAADFTAAQLVNTRFDGADLSDARLDGTSIVSSSFSDAGLRGVRLDRLAGYQPPLLSPHTGLEGAKDFSEEQAGQLRQATLRPRSTTDRQPGLPGAGDALDPIYPWQFLPEPDSIDDPIIRGGVVARALRQSQVKLPAEAAELLAARDKGWAEMTFRDDGTEPNFDPETTPSLAERSRMQALKVWSASIDHFNRHEAGRKWLASILKSHTESARSRRQALTVLLRLSSPEAAREAFVTVLQWYQFESPRSVADAEFRERVVRHYLVAHAIGNPSLSDEAALSVVRGAYGPGWESFLERYAAAASFFDLKPEELQAMQSAQGRARHLLSVSGVQRRPALSHSAPSDAPVRPCWIRRRGGPWNQVPGAISRCALVGRHVPASKPRPLRANCVLRKMSPPDERPEHALRSAKLRITWIPKLGGESSRIVIARSRRRRGDPTRSCGVFHGARRDGDADSQNPALNELPGGDEPRASAVGLGRASSSLTSSVKNHSSLPDAC